MTVDTTTIQSWLDEEYNDYVEIYDNNDSVRLTDGSAAHYVDISVQEDTFQITGEKFGEVINTSCKADRTALIETLSQTF